MSRFPCRLHDERRHGSILKLQAEPQAGEGFGPVEDESLTLETSLHRRLGAIGQWGH
jgi:hypothetical protein